MYNGCRGLHDVHMGQRMLHVDVPDWPPEGRRCEMPVVPGGGELPVAGLLLG